MRYVVNANPFLSPLLLLPYPLTHLASSLPPTPHTLRQGVLVRRAQGSGPASEIIWLGRPVGGRGQVDEWIRYFYVCRRLPRAYKYGTTER